MDGDDLLKSGATGVFGAVTNEPVKDAAPGPPGPAAASPVKTEPSNAASSGGFTQLLRALNYDAVKNAVKEAQAAAEPPAPVAGVQGPERLRPTAEPVEASAANKAAVPPASAQVTSFPPPSMPVAAPPAAPSAPSGGSFTQLFQKLEAEPTKEIETAETKEIATAAAPSFTQLFAVPEPVASTPPAAERTEPPPSSPGSFTQLFVGVDAGSAGDAHPLMMDSVESGAPVERAEPTAERVDSATPGEPSASSPGSFTQMFQALGTPVGEHIRHEAVPVSGPNAQAPGSFTQMFQALGEPAAEEARYLAPPVPEPPKQAASAPGSFTQMFQTLREEPQSSKEPEPKPGSFTQMFGSPALSSTPAVPPPPSSYERPFAASAPAREESGASQMFSTYQEPKVEANQPVFSPVEAAPAAKLPLSSTPASGGLTQLLRALDQPSQAPKPYAAANYPPVDPTPAASRAASFTGVYGELGTAPAPSATPMAPAPAPQPPSAAGPSEFTRLINASAMRETALRGGGEAAAPASPAPAPAGGSGFAMPSGMPAVPPPTFPKPVAPAASFSGPAGAHGSASAAEGGQASFAAPKLPSAPQVKPPEMPKAAGAPAGLQKYVPLLLILVIFLLLAILIAVVVLMKK